MLLSNLFVSVMNGSFCLTINTCALRNLILGNCIHLFGLRSRHYFMATTGITIHVVVAMYAYAYHVSFLRVSNESLGL